MSEFVTSFDDRVYKFVTISQSPTLDEVYRCIKEGWEVEIFYSGPIEYTGKFTSINKKGLNFTTSEGKRLTLKEAPEYIRLVALLDE